MVLQAEEAGPDSAHRTQIGEFELVRFFMYFCAAER